MKDNFNLDKASRMILLTIAVIIIAVVSITSIVNSPTILDSDFTPYSYFIPAGTTNRRHNAVNEPYTTYVSLRSVECPGFITNLNPNGMSFQTNGVYAGRKSEIRFTHFLFTKEELYGDSGGGNETIKRGNLSQILRIQSTKSTPIQELTFSQLVDIQPTNSADPTGAYACYEIVAPFAFSYDNCNMDQDNKQIVILNSSNTCRITIKGVVNWYCAGVPGTDMDTDSRQDEGTISWNDHNTKHLTWIGRHNNSKKNTGSAGDLLGYGNNNTKFSIEVHTADGWKPVTWQQIYGIS